MKNLKRRLPIFLFSFYLGLCGAGYANAISMPGKPELSRKDKQNGTVMIKFKVQWENSWKVNKPNNWDAAWLFAKYKEGGNEWHHVYIDTNNNAHNWYATDDKGTAVETLLKVGMSNVVNDKNVQERKAVGAFVYRKKNGQGTLIFDSVCLKWNYRAQGLDDQSIISIKVFSIEMVYVPQGPFFINDGGSSFNQLSVFKDSCIISKSSNRAIFPAPGKALANGVLQTGNIMAGISSPSLPVGEPFKDGKQWYLERSDVIDLYRDYPWYSGNWYNMQQIYSIPWGWMSSSVSSGWKSIRIAMPFPYKATGIYGGSWWSSWRFNGFCAQGSNDGTNWTKLVGYDDSGNASTTNYEGPQENKYFPIPLSKQNTYKYYEFNWYISSNYLTVNMFTMVDSVSGGSPENDWYYNEEKWSKYTGKKPLNYLSTLASKPIVSDSNFPSGYEAFYIMKYELSQHAYVDFLNTLTNAQQTTRSVIPPTAGAGIYYTGNTSEPSPWRNWIRVRIPQANAPAVYGLWYKKTSVDAWDQEKNAGNVAMCNMGWSDIAAYLSWSGLRPLSEWEYEKACRGPQTSLENEFAWGNTSYTYVSPSNGDIVDLNLSTEVAPAGANLVPIYSSMYNFPMRVGCFATNASTRIQAGAGYYGALNLSDNVTELYVNLSTKQGLEFSGEHGSGEINGNGDAEVKNWPDAISNSDNRAYGVGAKGYNYVSNNGGESYDLRYARVSCRLAMETRYADRYWFLGCRGGRTAPNN